METANVALGTQVVKLGPEGFVVQLLKLPVVLSLLPWANPCRQRGMSAGTVPLPPAAKNVVVFRNGDPFFQGRKFVVSQRRFLTFEAFLNEVTSTIQAPVAVRSIYTPRQGHRVTGLEDLRNGGQYVAGGFERFKRLNYLNPEMKQLNRKLKTDGAQNYPSISQRTSVPGQWRRRTNLPCIIYVFRNGDLLSPPFRLVLSKNPLGEWSSLLSRVSEKASLPTGAVKKLYKLNGDIVSSSEELVSGDYYVAVGLEKYKNLPYFELLVPPKIVHRSFRNPPSNGRWTQHQRSGNLHLPSQDGSSDSALLESPRQDFQVNLRRVQSTGVVQTEKSPNTSMAVVYKQPRKYPHKDNRLSVFHAEPAQAERISETLHQSAEEEEGSVYKMKGAREETAHAREVGEDEDTQVELPLDQRAAEIVEEEVMPKTNTLSRRKVETTDKVQQVQPIRRSAGDAGQDVIQKSHFHLGWRKAAASEK